MQFPDPHSQQISILPAPAWNTKLDAAIYYVEHGLEIFPVHGVVDGRCTCSAGAQCDPKRQGKHPATRNGFKDATSDVALVRAWWTEHPGWNIGSPTKDRILIDVDPRHGGDRVIDAWVQQYGDEFLKTVTCLSGGRGSHLRYRYPESFERRLSSRNAAYPGIDLKAEGGYVILPPSTHASGATYTWAPGKGPGEIETAEVPEWMLAELEALRVAGVPNGRKVADIVDGVPEGMRNSEVFRLASSLRGAGVPKWAAELTVLQAATRCVPPLSEREALEILNSAFSRYEPDARGGDLAASHVPTRVLLDATEPPIGWACHPALPEGQTALLCGAPGTGKTMLALWWARDVVNSGGTVLYFDADSGRRVIGRRIRAMRLTPEAAERFIYFEFPSTLTSTAGQYADLFKKHMPQLVVFDSMADFLTGAGMNEDSGRDVTLWFNDFVRGARQVDAAVLILDHVRKTGDVSSPRGSGAKLAKVDVAWLIAPGPLLPGELVRISSHKDREGICPPSMCYIFQAEEGRIAFLPSLPPPAPRTRDERIIDALHVAGAGGLTTADLEGLLGLSRQTVAKSLNDLIRRRLIVRSGATRGARYYAPQRAPEAARPTVVTDTAELLTSDSSGPLKGAGEEEDVVEEDSQSCGEVR